MQKSIRTVTPAERRDLAAQRLAQRLLDIASRGLLLDYGDVPADPTPAMPVGDPRRQVEGVRVPR